MRVSEQTILRRPALSSRLAFFSALTCTAVVAVALGYWPVRVSGEGWIDYLADDAFFYIVIAKNLARHGFSSFDGMTLTNGYQPLWQAMLALQFWLLPESLALIVFFEIAMIALAVFLAFRSVDADAWWCRLMHASD